MYTYTVFLLLKPPSAVLQVDVACGLGIQTAALITSMDSPLGRAVGNALEVAECVHSLQGKGPNDLMDLVVHTGQLHVLRLSLPSHTKTYRCLWLADRRMAGRLTG